MLSLIEHRVVDEYTFVLSGEPQNHVVVVAVIHALIVGPDPHLSFPSHRPSRIWKKAILHQLDDQPAGVERWNKFLLPALRMCPRPVTGKSDKSAKGKIRAGISFQRLGMLRYGPWREEIIVVQYDYGVSSACRNAEIEGGRFSFVLLTKIAYRVSKHRRYISSVVR